MRLTFGLIGANIAVFMLQVIVRGFTDIFALTPAMAFGGAWWQFFTYMFLHGGPTHLFLNMFFLFIFGDVMEHALGDTRYITLYVVSGLGSALIYIALMGATSVPMLGASGAVFGILAAYGFMFPRNKIWVPIPFIIPLPAFTVVILLAILEFVLGFLGLEPGIANFGHFGGIVTGLLLTYYWKRTSRPRGAQERREYEFFWE
jgi:membrane associated rhomboid family serine protease